MEREPPAPFVHLEPEVAIHPAVAIHDVIYDAIDDRVDDAMSLHLDAVMETLPVEESPSVSVFAVALAAAHRVGNAALAGVERIQSLGPFTTRWLMRGAALASTLSVLLLIGVNRGELMQRWDTTTTLVSNAAVAATAPPVPTPAPPGPAKGFGRVNITSPSGAAQVFVDGKPQGLVPMTIDLRAGVHRVVLKSAKGSVEKSVRVDAGDVTGVDEAIFPGWLAVTAAIDLTLSEGSQSLTRDERGWVILAPGPHDVHFTNTALGVHEVRHVIVKPGEPTWLSLVPASR